MLAALTAGATRLGDIGDAPETGANSADNRLIFWTDCDDVVSMSDDELDEWRARGVGGFVCMGERLRGLGGSQDFTGDPDADLEGESYELQRELRDSRIVERADARGMKMYLGVKLANYRNTSTPLVDWFDDDGWSQHVLPRMRELAAAARQLRFAGITFDQELYPQTGGVTTATWSWSYPGNTRTEAEVRAEAKQRGKELMRTILAGFPGVELAVYAYTFPGSWWELIQEEVNNRENAAADLLHIDFWDGMTSVEGFRAIRFWNSTFYKTPHRGHWEGALAYDANQVFATLSRRFSNWDHAAEHVYVSPFSWINPGPEGAFDRAHPPEYVEEQLLAFRRWSMGGEFANFVYGGVRDFDYSPYEGAMKAASTPGVIDATDPTIEITSAAGDSTIKGTAHDDLAIRVVRWEDDRDGSGTAQLTWEILSGDYNAGYDWKMRWSVPADDLTPGATEVMVTAEDIKGNLSVPSIQSLR